METMQQVTWPDFYFARHGETEWNRERRYQGSRDIPLNETGRKQADANGHLLRFLLEEQGADPAKFKWYASPLSRAAETMDRMRAAFDVDLPEVVYDPRLIEISFGKFEGLLHDEIAREREALAPGQRDSSYWHFRPEDGENYEDLADRPGLVELGGDFVPDGRGPPRPATDPEERDVEPAPQVRDRADPGVGRQCPLGGRVVEESR